jgi:hypothetical protein
MKYFILSILFIVPTLAFSQVGIGTNSPKSSIKLNVSATNKVFLLPSGTAIIK